MIITLMISGILSMLWAFNEDENVRVISYSLVSIVCYGLAALVDIFG